MALLSFPRPLFLLVFLMVQAMGAVDVRAQSSYAQDCLTNVDNATVVVPTSTNLSFPNGDQLSADDTLAVYTDDGVCAGYGVWAADGTDLAFAAAGPNDVDAAQNGFASGEQLKFEAYDVSEETRVDLKSKVAYTSCSEVSLPLCQDDGSYQNGALFVLSALSGSPLPVELTDFRVKRDGSRATLAWQTASETNNAGFRVQHRPIEPQSDDASSLARSSWTTLGFTEGAGTTTEAQSYSFRTEKLPFGDHEFRLQQVDRDGSTALSGVVTLEINLDEPFALSGVYPNPLRTAGALDLTVRRTQSVTVVVFDVLGRRVETLHDGEMPNNQTRTLRFNTDRLASGTYFVRVRGERFVTTRRFTVVQ
jgi:hypothetical protein